MIADISKDGDVQFDPTEELFINVEKDDDNEKKEGDQ